MMNLRENRDRMIQRTIQSMRRSELTEIASAQDIKDFEYEPSEIILALFETENEKPNNFKNRKNKKKSRQKLEEFSFFSNSKTYLGTKESKDNNETTN